MSGHDRPPAKQFIRAPGPRAPSTNTRRLEHRAELVQLLAIELPLATTEHWLERFCAAGIPAGPINTVRQMFADPTHRRAACRG
ncbi:MAG: CoA transferase [Chloroflexi bacterium]|nr:CoA transferase [Chloroflexota bacterium]